jgi:hypothetical protein
VYGVTENYRSAFIYVLYTLVVGNHLDCVCWPKCAKLISLKSPVHLSSFLTSHTELANMQKRCKCECAHLRVLLEHLNLVPSPRFLCTFVYVDAGCRTCVSVLLWSLVLCCMCAPFRC